MPQLSVAKWAESQHISRQAAYKRIKSGKVKLNERGLIDSEQAEADWSANRDCHQQLRGAPAARAERHGSPRPLPAAVVLPAPLPSPPPVAAVPEQPAVQTDLPLEGVVDGRFFALPDDTPLAEAQRITTIFRARTQKLEHAKLEGRLVEVEQVETATLRRARVERDEWLNWPGSVAPDLAAELGIDERIIHDALDRYVRKHLEKRAAI